MKYRQLGRTGLEVSEIGFGTWGIGGPAKGMPAYGPTEDKESKLALSKAFELGVNFYDTAGLYGNGHSERLLGEVFKNIRTEVIIATKAGLLDADGGENFTTGHLRLSLEASLRRLGTDYVDLFLLHSPPINLLTDDPSILSLLQSLQDEGKVRAFGISVQSPGHGLTAVNEYGLKAIEVNFNLVDQRAVDSGLLDLCEREGVGVIVRTPLSFGFLTGAYSAQEKFDSGDHRSKWSPKQIERWAGAYELFLTAPVNGETLTPAQTALKFCLSYSGVSSVIPGMLTRGHVEENVLAGNIGRFSVRELEQARQIYKDNVFFEA